MSQLLGSISAMTLTVQATAAISSNQLIGFEGAPAGDGDPVLGIAVTDAAIGDNVSIKVITASDLIAGGPIPQGSPIQSNADALPIVKDAGAFVGTALTTAVNPGDIVKVLIK